MPSANPEVRQKILNLANEQGWQAVHRKLSEVDLQAQELWDDYTEYKRAMFSKTNTKISPWKVIRANRKTIARVNVINHVLKSIPYDKNTEV